MKESPFIVWREIFAVGHQALDAEHRRLVDAINKIHSAERAGQMPVQVTPMLNALLVAAEQHFEHENSVMRDIGRDPKVSEVRRVAFLQAYGESKIDKHISAHESELSKLRSIIGTVGLGANPAWHKLNDELRDWFVQHVIKYDAHLKAAFQAR